MTDPLRCTPTDDPLGPLAPPLQLHLDTNYVRNLQTSLGVWSCPHRGSPLLGVGTEAVRTTPSPVKCRTTRDSPPGPRSFVLQSFNRVSQGFPTITCASRPKDLSTRSDRCLGHPRNGPGVHLRVRPPTPSPPPASLVLSHSRPGLRLCRPSPPTGTHPTAVPTKDPFVSQGRLP